MGMRGGVQNSDVDPFLFFFWLAVLPNDTISSFYTHTYNIYIYIYIVLHTHTHTHTYNMYIYIYI